MNKSSFQLPSIVISPQSFNFSTLGALVIVLIIDSMGNGLVLPILPALLLNQQYGLIAAHTYIGQGAWYGIVISIASLMSFISMPIFGHLSDHYGRKPLLAWGLAGIFISYVLAIFSIWFGSLALFIISRVLVGLCMGTYVVVNAMVGDMTQGLNNKVLCFRWLSFASMMGLIIGPLVGTSSGLANSKYGLILPFSGGAFLTLSNLILVLIVIKETYREENNHGFVGGGFKKVLVSLINIFKFKQCWRWKRLIISYIFFQLGITLYTQAIVLYLAVYFHYNALKLSVFWIVMAISLSISAIIFQPLLLRFFKVSTLVSYGFKVLLLAFLLLSGFKLLHHTSLLNIQIWLWVISVIIFILYSLLATAFNAIFSELAGEMYQGEVMGTLGQLRALMTFISALVVGFLVLGHWGLMIIVTNLLILIGLMSYSIDDNRVGACASS